MSYGDARLSIGKKIAVGFIVAFGIAFLIGGLKGGLSAWNRSRTDWSASFDREVTGHPQMGPMFTRFRDAYPADYARFKTAAVARASSGASGIELRTFGSNWMRDFMRARTGVMAQAPHAELAAFRAAQLAVAHRLQASSDVFCGHYVMTGLRPDDRVSDDVLPLVARQGERQIDAAVAGARAPAGRDVAALSRADSVALVRAMQQLGISQADMALIGATNGLQNAAPARQCAVGVKMMEAAASLPDAAADRVTGFLLTHS